MNWPTRDSAALAASHPNVVVTRTFSKALGLAGLRIGYALASRDLIARIAAQSMPFTVTDLACAAAAHRYADTEHHRSRMTEIRAERDRLASELRAIGLEVVPQCHQLRAVTRPPRHRGAPAQHGSGGQRLRDRHPRQRRHPRRERRPHRRCPRPRSPPCRTPTLTPITPNAALGAPRSREAWLARFRQPIGATTLPRGGNFLGTVTHRRSSARRGQ
jgi:hypothetical protein